MDPRAALTWEQAEGGFGELEKLRPTWKIEPNINTSTAVVRRKFNIPESVPCIVEFLAQGTFNKVYTVQCPYIDNPIVRVTLPVQPRLKTLSERGTIEYIRYHTPIPTPEIFSYSVQCENDSDFDFEYIVMERVAGKKLKEQWETMSWLKKEVVVRQVVDYLTQLFRQRFHRLGNIYTTQDLQKLATKDILAVALLGAEHAGTTVDFYVGEVVSIELFYNDHSKVDVARGPYKHSQHWLAAYLELAAHNVESMSDELVSDPGSDSESELGEEEKHNETGGSDSEMSSQESSNVDSDNEDENEDEYVDPESITAAKARIQCLKHLLPRIFPDSEPEEFILHHQDLSDNNIMIDATYNLSAIIDWECVHTVPLWSACQIPRFLRGADREKPPPYTEEFENEFYEQAYYDDLAEYEKTQLRKVFVEEMQRLCPEWVEVHGASDVKADFVFCC